VRFHAIGQPGPENVHNVGVVNFSAVRDEVDAGKLHLFARVLNFRPQPVSWPFQIEVYSGGRLQKVYPPLTVKMPARKVIKSDPNNADAPPASDQPGEAGIPFELTDFDERAELVVRGRLLDNKDNFPLDDEAWLVVGVVRRAKVLIVGRPNAILDAFFNEEAT